MSDPPGFPRRTKARKQRAAAAAAESDTPSAPVAFAPEGPAPSGCRAWQPIVFERNFSVKGGYYGKNIPLESTEIEDETLVKLDKGADWFLKLAGGASMKKGGMARTKVVEQLRLKSTQPGRDTEAAPPPLPTDDPMNSLDLLRLPRRRVVEAF